MVHWGMIGCGDVTEVKSGPGFRHAEGSSLIAVMNRTRVKADDYARRHSVPRVHETAEGLVADPEVDAIYIATHPSSHRDLALLAASAGKPCLVEKPMAMNHAECVEMNGVFAEKKLPLWVAFYRRALPRFLKVRELLTSNAIGRVTSVQIEVLGRLPAGPGPGAAWRVDPAVGGAGHFFDVGSHNLDILDFLIGPIAEISGIALNTGAAYAAEDVTAAVFRLEGDIAGTGVWNFNADRSMDRMTIQGTSGSIATALFADEDVVLEHAGERQVFGIRNPPHVHQPLIQTIVDELNGRGRCSATGEAAARASWALEQCVKAYYAPATSRADSARS